MCNDCHKSDCFEVDQGNCDKGCDINLNTDCVFRTGKQKKLFNIGITEGASLSHILDKIDEKLSQLLTADFVKYDMNGLNVENNIHNIKDFVYHITAKVKELEQKDEAQDLIVLSLDEDIDELTEKIESVLNIGISDAKLNINNTDTIDVVLAKIIDALDNINPETFEFTDTNSVLFSRNGSEISATVKVSGTAGNIISIQDDGIFAALQSISSILKSINDSASLQAAFKNLVNKSFPPLSFDIMSNTSQIIRYVNILGDTIDVTAKPNVLLELVNVKHVITPPSTNLIITFKGIS